MKKLLLILSLFLAITSSFAQENEKNTIITTDIDNFWTAYDKIRLTKDTTLQYQYLNNFFLEKGTPGLKAIGQARNYTAKSYVDAINNYPLFWNSVRANTYKVKNLTKEIFAGIHQLKQFEIAMADKNTVTSEFPKSFVNLVSFFKNNSPEHTALTNVHEYVHTQQKTNQADYLLAQSVMEGVAEYVSFNLRDLGYYVGYNICKKYDEQATDHQLAIKEMIELDYSNPAELYAFVDKSGYFNAPVQDLKARYEKERPRVMSVGPFKNKDQEVDPGITELRIEFSVPMNTQIRNFKYGSLGPDHFPQINKLISFSPDGKTAVFELKLKAGQSYQFIVGDGFRILQSNTSKPMLKKNTPAPDFQLLNPEGEVVSLSDFKNKKNVVLLFYPADWSPVCGDEISLFSQMKPIFDKEDAVLLGISVDSFFCHKAYTAHRKIHFQLLADFEPKGAVARQYGVYNEKAGYNSRALFLIDKSGTVQWSYLAPDEVNPGADG
eukprot:gene17743-21211_t